MGIDSRTDAEHLEALREVLMTCVGIFAKVDEQGGVQPVLTVRNLQAPMRVHEEISVSGDLFVSGLGRKLGLLEDIDQTAHRIVTAMREEES